MTGGRPRPGQLGQMLRDEPERGPDEPALEKDVPAKMLRALDEEREIQLALGLEPGDLSVVENPVDEMLGLLCG